MRNEPFRYFNLLEIHQLLNGIDFDLADGEFRWDAYLAKTASTSVPPRAFKPRSPLGFKTGMKLECVDPLNPQLIRVATVASVKVIPFFFLSFSIFF